MPEELKALILLCRLPLFSVRKSLAIASMHSARIAKIRTSYQICSTTLLPPPSALKGALAASYLTLFPNKFQGGNYDERGKGAVEFLSRKLVYAGAKPYRSALFKNPILLRRARSLEGRGDTSDAMLREYIFFHSIIIVYVFKSLNGTEEKEFEEAAWLINQLGDSESLGAVSKVFLMKVNPIEGKKVNVYVKLTKKLVDELGRVTFQDELIVEPMLEDPVFSGIRRDERLYMLPLRRMKEKGTKEIYYVEGKIPIRSNYHVRIDELNEDLFLRID